MSAFDSSSPIALVVEGNSIPDGLIVGVEFPETEEDAQKLAKEYEKIDAVVQVDGTKVYSALNTADPAVLEEVVEAGRG